MPLSISRYLLPVLIMLLACPVYSQAPQDSVYVIINADGTTRVDSTGSFLKRGITSENVIVSATRSARALEDVPVPTSVINAEGIAISGSRRLTDILSEQPGLQIIQNHGSSSLQIQGFSSDYALILIDGEPVVGRNAGALDLERLSVTSVEQVEIVRGPLSSRYGSDALAGVVNLVTRRPGLANRGRVNAQYMSHGTSDLSAEIEAGEDQWGVRGILNRYGSGGFSLNAESGALTIPEFADYSGEIHAYYSPADDTQISLRSRIARENQLGRFFVSDVLYQDEAARTEMSVNPVIRQRFSSRLRGEVALYGATFDNGQSTVNSSTDELTLDTHFLHTYGKGEAVLTWTPLSNALLHVGSGMIVESVNGDRYASRRNAHQSFAFTELEWMPTAYLDLVVSARYDAPSDYASRFTPKLALLVKPADWARVRASVGSGYKAPAFRQRYLVFTNAAAGYLIYGAEEARGELQRLEEMGAIDRYLLQPEDLGVLRAESSIAYGFGIEVEPLSRLLLKANVFHNEVKDLIDTQPIAVRTNGQQIFSYFNLARIYTRGLETELTWSTMLPGQLGSLAVGAGYQFLDTADRDVLDMIADGRLFRRENGRDVRVSRSDYGGLFGRSRHSGSFQLTHRLEDLQLTTAARLIWRGRYGFADTNSNLVLDHPGEYAPGHAMLNLTISKTFGPADFQIGVRNALDYVDPMILPNQPGRSFFLSAGYTF